MDNMTLSANFNLELAIKQFKYFVRPEENLLKANLVRYLPCNSIHFMVVAYFSYFCMPMRNN